MSQFPKQVFPVVLLAALAAAVALVATAPRKAEPAAVVPDPPLTSAIPEDTPAGMPAQDGAEAGEPVTGDPGASAPEIAGEATDDPGAPSPENQPPEEPEGPELLEAETFPPMRVTDEPVVPETLPPETEAPEEAPEAGAPEEAPETEAPEEAPETEAPAEPPEAAAPETPEDGEPGNGNAAGDPGVDTPAAPRFAEAVTDTVRDMTEYELLTQMFIATYDGSWATAGYASQYGFGGYITFAEDFENDSPESFREGVERVRAASKIPPLIAVDEEGGTVTRASKYSWYRAVPFASPRDVYLAGGLEGIRADAAEKAEHLSALGLNYNLGPVADIALNTWDFMYARSPGQDAETTAAIVTAIIAESQARGVATSVKHFPGYGSVSDTHTGLAYDWRSVEELEGKDLIPFQRAMDAGVSSVMVSHIITNLDPGRPATVSSAVVDYIRNKMGYDGVLITDDMRMNGILDFCPTGSGSLEAILAGYDLICCTNWPEQFPIVWAAVENGTLSRERLEASAARVLQMKYDLGIWQP